MTTLWIRAARHFVVGSITLSCCTAAAVAATLPVAPVSVALPPPAANAFGVSVAFGPANGLMYVWDGASVLKQDGFNSASFTSIGSVGSGSADAGPIAFSRDASALLLGNGFGGFVGGPAHEGKVFSIPAVGGSSNVPLGTVAFHNSFVAAPLGASLTRYFVDAGADLFGTSSSVSVFDASTGSNLAVIQNIPGAGSSIALDAADNLYVGIGFGAQVGEIRTFSLAALTTAFNTATPLAWTAGTLFNGTPNNSGAGMFLDARGYLFVGGPDGIAVFDTAGHTALYDNGGYTSITYDPLHDRLLVTGFGNQQGIYPASMFHVPEPGTATLALLAAVLVCWRRRGG